MVSKKGRENGNLYKRFYQDSLTSAAQTGFELLAMFLAQPPKCFIYRKKLPDLSLKFLKHIYSLNSLKIAEVQEAVEE